MQAGWPGRAGEAAAGEQIAALKADQQAAVEKRVAEALEGLQQQKEDLQREKDAAVLAERAKVLEAAVASCRTCSASSRSKTANELGEGSEVDLFEQLRAAFESDRISASARASTAPT